MIAEGWGYTNVLLSETLFDVESGFMTKNELAVGVHISLIAAVGVFETPTTCKVGPSVTITVPAGSQQASGASYVSQLIMSDVFETHFNDASTSDITVKTGETKIHAHKIILIAQSAVFKAMFQVKSPVSHLQHKSDFRVV